jgi:hypothetical protein
VREVVSSSIKERDHFRIPRGCRSCRLWAVPSPEAQGHTDVGNPYRSSRDTDGTMSNEYSISIVYWTYVGFNLNSFTMKEW